MSEEKVNEQELQLKTDNISVDSLKQKLDDDALDIVQQIVGETDPKQVQDLTALFNLNQVKKNVMRVNQLNDIIDKVTTEAGNRITNAPHSFENKELADYLKVLYASMEKTQGSISGVTEKPMIQINQQNNYGIDGEKEKISLDKESREKVSNVIQEILKLSNQENAIIELDTEEE